MVNLHDKLGAFLWQFPPNVTFDSEPMTHFLSRLPHEPRMVGHTAPEVGKKRPLRHAVEIRHPSVADTAFIAMLRRYKVALVVADTAGKWPYCEDVTANFLYLRLHGDQERYASGYTDATLARWAARIGAWAGGVKARGAPSR